MKRPIRKRAFWRALKRGELWAIVPYQHMAGGGSVLSLGSNVFAKIVVAKCCPADVAYLTYPLDDWGVKYE